MKYLSKTAHKNSERNCAEYRLRGRKCGLPGSLSMFCGYSPGGDGDAGRVASEKTDFENCEIMKRRIVGKVTRHAWRHQLKRFNFVLYVLWIAMNGMICTKHNIRFEWFESAVAGVTQCGLQNTRETEIMIRVTGAVTHSAKNMTSCRHASLKIIFGYGFRARSSRRE